MNDERVNFDPLDPTRDASFEQRVSSIASDAMLARRNRASARSVDLLDALSASMRPALAAAALIGAVSLAALLHEARSSSQPRGASAAEILGIPSSLIALTRSSEAASVTQLAAALGISEQGSADVR